MKPYVDTVNEVYVNDFQAGKIDLGITYSGDGLRIQAARKKRERHRVVAPEGKSEIWTDNWAISAYAPDPVAAHAWINFILQPEVNAKEMEYVAYEVGTPASYPARRRPRPESAGGVPRPDPERLRDPRDDPGARRTAVRRSGTPSRPRSVLRRGLAAVVVVAALGAAPAAHAQVTIVLDPGHNRYPNLRHEPIGPGSSTSQDQGRRRHPRRRHRAVRGVGEPADRVSAADAASGRRAPRDHDPPQDLLRRKGNLARARIANRAHAALFLRIHADGSTDHSVRGTSMLYPALHAGWTDDIYGRSRQAARIVQSRLVHRLGWPDRGLVAARRPDRLQLGERAGHPDRGRLPHEPLRGPGAGDGPRPSERMARGLEGGVLHYLRARGLR